MSSGESPTVAALQDVLAGEHAAVYVYGVLGAQTSRSRQRTLYEDVIGAFLAHRQRRDRLTATITRLGDQPVAADPAYDVPADLSTSTHVEAAALHVERG
ncbi:MAG: ferritin-like domain-containing protein, partial [Nocardioidaceae bacterium]|nr:ferritin-like domain-containing protein [Nocardioidaceae bacterium]